MQWNTSSFDGLELCKLQGIEAKQREREKCPDAIGTRTLWLQVGNTSPNNDTTSSLVPGYSQLFNVAQEKQEGLRDNIMWVA